MSVSAHDVRPRAGGRLNYTTRLRLSHAIHGAHRAEAESAGLRVVDLNTRVWTHYVSTSRTGCTAKPLGTRHSLLPL